MGVRDMLVGLRVTGSIDSSVGRVTDQAVRSQQKLGAAVQKTKSKMGSVRDAVRYGRQLNRLEGEKKDVGRASASLERRIERVSKKYDEARRSAGFYSKETDKVARKQRAQADEMASFEPRHVGALVATAGLAAAGAAVRAAGGLETQAIYLRQVIDASDGDKDAAVARTRAFARDFARNTLATESEVLDITYNLGSAGFDEEMSRVGAVLSHKLAMVTRGEVGSVSEIVGTAMNNLGDGMVGTAEARMNRIGNVLARAQLRYSIKNFDQLGQGVAEGAGSARDYGLEIEQFAATIGELNTAGLTSSRAGTAVNAVMRNLSKASDALGVGIVRTQTGGVDLVETLAGMRDQLEGMDAVAKGDLLQEIFGDEGKKGVSPLLDRVDDLRAGVIDLRAASEGGLVAKEYERFLDSGPGKFKRMTGNVAQLATTVGGQMTPVLESVLAPIGAVAAAIAWGVDNIPGVGVAVGVVTVALIGLASWLAISTSVKWGWNAAMMLGTNRKLIGYVGSLTKGLGSLSGAFTLSAVRAKVADAAYLSVGASSIFARRMQTTWAASAVVDGRKIGLLGRGLKTAAVGARMLGTALMFTPVGAVIGAIALGGFLVYKYWKPIKAFFGGFWSEVGPPLKAVAGGVGRIAGAVYRLTPGLRLAGAGFRLIGRGISWVGSLLKPVTGNVDGATSAGVRFGQIMRSVFSWSPVGIVIRMWKKVGDVYAGMTGWIGDIVKGGVANITGALTAPFRLVESLWKKIRGVKDEAASVDIGLAANDNVPSGAGSDVPSLSQARPSSPGGGGVVSNVSSETSSESVPPFFFDDRRPPPGPGGGQAMTVWRSPVGGQGLPAAQIIASPQTPEAVPAKAPRGPIKVEVNVHPTPGMNERALAELVATLVAKEIDDLERDEEERRLYG